MDIVQSTVDCDKTFWKERLNNPEDKHISY